MELNATASPRSVARIAGVCQLLEAVTATFGLVLIPHKLIVAGNATATATNILGHQPLFWSGFALSLLGVLFHIAWVFLLYELLKPVSRRLSRFTLLVIIVGCALQAVASLLYLGPMLILTAGDSLSAFTAEQLHALAFIFFKFMGYALNTYLVFFGLWCFLTGLLIFRSSFLPRVLGIMLAISGLGWMIYLYPPLALRLFMPYIAGASALGEIPLELWLIVMTVNADRWNEQVQN